MFTLSLTPSQGYILVFVALLAVPGRIYSLSVVIALNCGAFWYADASTGRPLAECVFSY